MLSSDLTFSFVENFFFPWDSSPGWRQWKFGIDRSATPTTTTINGKSEIRAMDFYQIVNNLFDGEPMGFDLVALNIQRGRDHGIPGYVKYREICQVGRARSFEDLSVNMSPEVRSCLLCLFSELMLWNMYLVQSLSRRMDDK